MSIYFLAAAIAVGFYMAWNIGANDTANSMAPACGAGAITFKQAVIIAGILEFAGAYFVGTHVTQTIRAEIISPESFIGQPQVMAFALFAAILAAALWVFMATWRSMPVSTTHSIVGALTGVGIAAGGTSMIAWDRIGHIVISWVSSPLFSGILAFALFKLISISFPPTAIGKKRVKKYFPAFIFVTFYIIFLSFLFKTPLGENLQLSDSYVFSIAALLSLAATIFISALIKWKVKNYDPENIFRLLQIITACYVAFAHGANDVANAVGPLAGILSIYEHGYIGAAVEVPGYVLAIGGFGISLGIFTWGYKVIKTVGCSITELTNTRGFSITFSAATSVIIASKMGLPVSTTHAVVGAVVGIGLARGLEAVDFRVLNRIFLAWVVTLPVAAVLGYLIFSARGFFI